MAPELALLGLWKIGTVTVAIGRAHNLRMAAWRRNESDCFGKFLKRITWWTLSEKTCFFLILCSLIHGHFAQGFAGLGVKCATYVHDHSCLLGVHVMNLNYLSNLADQDSQGLCKQWALLLFHVGSSCSTDARTKYNDHGVRERKPIRPDPPKKRREHLDWTSSSSQFHDPNEHPTSEQHVYSSHPSMNLHRR
jgi:hypothetical protein